MKSTSLIALFANLVHSPSSSSGAAPALRDVTSVFKVGAFFGTIPAAIYASNYASNWLGFGLPAIPAASRTWSGTSRRPLIIDFALDGTVTAREAWRRRRGRARSYNRSPFGNLQAWEKELLYNEYLKKLYPVIHFNYTVGSSITFQCLDPVTLTGTVAVSVQYTSAIHPTVRASSSRGRFVGARLTVILCRWWPSMPMRRTQSTSAMAQT